MSLNAAYRRLLRLGREKKKGGTPAALKIIGV
jgi:hypothetical protein